jgi:membrane protease YdiL (CAAX protease family)
MSDRAGLFHQPPVREVLILWGASFLAIVLAFLVLPSQSSLVATVAFLYLPWPFMSRRGQDYRDLGVTLSNWRQDVRLFLVIAAVLIPVFFLAFTGFMQVLARLPPNLAHVLTPLQGRPQFHLRLPEAPLAFAWQAVGQTGVVALPEEFFFRGYMLERLKVAWPPQVRVLGVPVGRAFFLSALLFALSHLAIFQAWRLWVFFPALLFGWLREKTGTVLGSTLLHAFCNLYEQVLEASFR